MWHFFQVNPPALFKQTFPKRSRTSSGRTCPILSVFTCRTRVLWRSLNVYRSELLEQFPSLTVRRQHKNFEEDEQEDDNVRKEKFRQYDTNQFLYAS